MFRNTNHHHDTYEPSFHIAEIKAKQKEYAVKRQNLEARQKLREATAAEFGVVHIHSLKRYLKRVQTQRRVGQTRNQNLFQTITEIRRQHPASSSSNDQATAQALERAKHQFSTQVERVYPAWQAQLERRKLLTLRQLEEKKRDIDRRRTHARETFERERALASLIQHTREEVEAASNLEKTEVLARELTRHRQARDHVEWKMEEQATVQDRQDKILDQHYSRRPKLMTRGEREEEGRLNKLRTLEPLEPVDSVLPRENQKQGSPDVFTPLASTVQLAAVSPTNAPMAPEIEMKHNTSAPLVEKMNSLSCLESPGTNVPETPPTASMQKEASSSLDMNDVIHDLSFSDRQIVFQALFARIEDTLKTSKYFRTDYRNAMLTVIQNSVPSETKEEMIKMAVRGRTTQLKFFGLDACSEVLKDSITDLSSSLFPSTVFEGKMSLDKFKKFHHHNGSSAFYDIWNSLCHHFQLLIRENIVTAAEVVQILIPSFTSTMDSRSTRKIKPFLIEVFDTAHETTAKDDALGSLKKKSQAEEQKLATSSLTKTTTASNSAVLATGAAPKSQSEQVEKLFQKDKLSLSQKLIRGNRLGEEFEDDDEIDLDQFMRPKSPKKNLNTKVVQEEQVNKVEEDEFDF